MALTNSPVAGKVNALEIAAKVVTNFRTCPKASPRSLKKIPSKEKASNFLLYGMRALLLLRFANALIVSQESVAKWVGRKSNYVASDIAFTKARKRRKKTEIKSEEDCKSNPLKEDGSTIRNGKEGPFGLLFRRPVRSEIFPICKSGRSSRNLR